MRITYILAALALVVATTGCAFYINHDRDKVLLEGIDIDQTLHVAADELEDGVVLGLWAMRDQIITAEQATEVSTLYFAHIEDIDSGQKKRKRFNVWHLTWAISNMYRHGDDGVKAALQKAYEDAARRVEDLDFEAATIHFDDDRIYLGEFHGFGHAYLQGHLVVPGNDEYIQCYEEYKNKWKSCPQ